MVVPELRWPITPATLASTSFWATVVPCFGSAWSSSGMSSNFTLAPPISGFLVLASSMARRAPFSLSLPRCAWGPVSGAEWPILTVRVGTAGGAGNWAWGAGACALGSSLPQPSRARAAVTARVRVLAESCMVVSGKFAIIFLEPQWRGAVLMRRGLCCPAQAKSIQHAEGLLRRRLTCASRLSREAAAEDKKAPPAGAGSASGVRVSAWSIGRYFGWSSRAFLVKNQT